MNKLSGWTLDMIGASAFTWEVQHMLGHHPYTNLLDVKGEERKKRETDATDKARVRALLLKARNASDASTGSNWSFISLHICSDSAIRPSLSIAVSLSWFRCALP